MKCLFRVVKAISLLKEMETIISQQSYTIFTHLTHPTPLNNVKPRKIIFHE